MNNVRLYTDMKNCYSEKQYKWYPLSWSVDTIMEGKRAWDLYARQAADCEEMREFYTHRII